MLGFTWQEAGKEGVVKFVHGPWLETELCSLKHLNKLFAIDKLNGRGSVSIRFRASVRGKRASCDYYAFVSSANHGVAEIANLSP
jgi:hypothetical protein